MDDSKFIPAYASDHVSLRCRPREPAACNFEALVPGLMPESIIYRLKTVEIRQEQGSRPLALGSAYLTKEGFKPGPGTQSGERIAFRQVTKLLDHSLLGSDVLFHPEYSCGSAVRKLDTSGYSYPSVVTFCGNYLSVQGKAFTCANCPIAGLVKQLAGFWRVEFDDFVPRQWRLRNKIKEFIHRIRPT